MWTSTLDFDPKRVLFTQLIGHFYPDIYYSAISPLQVQNLPRQPLPASDWVRVRNRLAGICGSDLQLIYGNGDVRVAPSAAPAHKYIYPGHELVGEIIEIGNDVQHLNVGDRVALRYGPNCLSAGIQPLCRSCAIGNYNLCENSVRSGVYAIGGGWSEEILLHEQQLFPLPAAISDEQAVMLEPAAVALHAIMRHMPQANERVLIIGAGTVGLLTLQLLHALAPQAEVSVLARHPFQVEQATRLGATHIIYPQNAYASVQRATGARIYHGMLGNQMLYGGYDVIFDTVGQRKTLHHALRWTRAQATVVLAGLNLHMMRIDLTPIWYQEINLIGSTSHGIEIWPPGTNQHRSTFSVVAEMIERGLIHPEQLITHHFALNNYKHALATAKNKGSSRAIKVVFDYSLQPASVVPTVRASARQHYPAITRKIQESDITPVPAEQEPALHNHVPTAPYAATVQTTPPVAPIDEDALLQAMSYTDEDDADTATALPAISKYMHSAPKKPAVTRRPPQDSAAASISPEHRRDTAPVINAIHAANSAAQQISPVESSAPTVPQESAQVPFAVNAAQHANEPPASSDEQAEASSTMQNATATPEAGKLVLSEQAEHTADELASITSTAQDTEQSTATSAENVAEYSPTTSVFNALTESVPAADKPTVIVPIPATDKPTEPDISIFNDLTEAIPAADKPTELVSAVSPSASDISPFNALTEAVPAADKPTELVSVVSPSASDISPFNALTEAVPAADKPAELVSAINPSESDVSPFNALTEPVPVADKPTEPIPTTDNGAQAPEEAIAMPEAAPTPDQVFSSAETEPEVDVPVSVAEATPTAGRTSDATASQAPEAAEPASVSQQEEQPVTPTNKRRKQETKSTVSSSAYVDETPTVQVAPRPHSRKKKRTS